MNFCEKSTLRSKNLKNKLAFNIIINAIGNMDNYSLHKNLHNLTLRKLI